MRRKIQVVDERKARDIHVSWQLALVVIALFTLPLALIPAYMMMAGDKSVSGSVLGVSLFIALGLVLMMVIAIRSRIRGAAGEVRVDDQPMPAWILRQVLFGVGLCLLAAVVMAFLVWSGVRESIAVKWCLALAGPGILLIGHAMVPASGD